jgi:hypothetical protein
MKNIHPRTTFGYQRGSAAVEAAVVLAFVIVPLLACTLFLGRYFWYYNVAQKVAHDTALYMAGAPLQEIQSRGATGLAESIIQIEAGDLAQASLEPSVSCGYLFGAVLRFGTCSSTRTPDAVQTLIFMRVTDPFLPGLTGNLSIAITAVATMNYVGN